jgi:hypothetical protein
MAKRTSTLDLPEVLQPDLAKKICRYTQTDVIKIDVLTCNGQKLVEKLPPKLMDLILPQISGSVIGTCSFKTKEAVRVHLLLNSPMMLIHLWPMPEYSIVEISNRKYHFKIVGLNKIRPPNQRESIKLCISRIHFCVPLDIIYGWIKKFTDRIFEWPPRYSLTYCIVLDFLISKRLLWKFSHTVIFTILG